MIKNIKVLLLSLLLAIIWGELFLDISYAGKTSVFIGLFLTYLFTVYFRKVFKESKKALFITFPIIYFFLFVVIVKSGYLLKLTSPMLAGSILLLTCLFIVDKITSIWNIGLIITSCIFYTLIIYPQNERINFKSDMEPFGAPEDYKVEIKENIKKPDFSTIDLGEYKFLSKSLDTLKLDGKEYYFLETWNETCSPCIKAMKDLQAKIKNDFPELSHYYIYENKFEKVRKKYDKIFSFKHIKNKSQILIDLDQKFYTGLQMEGYPFFLLFDPKGNLIYKKEGYASSEKDIILDSLQKLVDSKN